MAILQAVGSKGLTMSDTTYSLTEDQAMEMAREEGTVLRVYDDATGLPIKPGSLVHGHPTIGTGRALDVNGITAAEADGLLRDDFQRLVALFSQFSWWEGLTSTRKFIVLDMAFQLGYSGVMKFSDMRNALVTGNFAAAKDAMLASRWAEQTPSRAERLAEAMRTGAFPAGA